MTTSLNKTLSISPYSGKIVEELDLIDEIRIWSYDHYNSYYRVLDDKQIVEILFVFNASRLLKVACPHYSYCPHFLKVGGFSLPLLSLLFFCPHYFPSKSKKSDLLRFFFVI
jgi:hypothetical protein